MRGEFIALSKFIDTNLFKVLFHFSDHQLLDELKVVRELRSSDLLPRRLMGKASDECEDTI